MANSSMQAQLDKIIGDFIDSEMETIDSCFSTVARDTVKELKSVSPKSPGGGDYAKSWSLKKFGKAKGTALRTGGITVVVYNKEHYRLTHLLEKGHVAKNQYGTYERVPAKPHIARAEENATRELVNELERRL